MTRAVPLFSHVLALSDGVGIFEHAEYRQPRVEHGYCVDDVARALVAVCRDEPAAERPVLRDVLEPEAMFALEETYLRFLLDAQTPDGGLVNRPGTAGRAGTVEDCWGRALWALGTASSRSSDPSTARRAAVAFTRSAVRRSPWSRAMAFAGLGAAEMLRSDPYLVVARDLLRDAAALVGPFRAEQAWPWPEPRLTYANAVLPDVLMAAGDVLHEDDLVDEGLDMLGWLLDLQSRDDRLSLVPATGWVVGEPLPAFDQQPIEVSTLADACVRAHGLTGDTRWLDAVTAAAAWFFGRNDSGTSLYDEESGGCCDGLEATGRNENQGAESTLALVTTLQHSARLTAAGG